MTSRTSSPRRAKSAERMLGAMRKRVMGRDDSRSPLALRPGKREVALLESTMARPEFTTSVAVRHLPEQSDRDKGLYAFAYTVTIKNSGDVTAQLIARHWIVSDARGPVDEVRGPAG